jgi:hypothetical protein
LEVTDAQLPGSITSETKTISFDVRPVPEVDASPATFAIREDETDDTYKKITLKQGGAASGLEYFYPNSYDLHPEDIDVTSLPAAAQGSISDSWTCTTAGATKECFDLFSPVAYGLTNFQYKVEIVDDTLGTGEKVVSNLGTVNVDVRPVITASDVAYDTNDEFKAIQDQPLNWKLTNGAGYSYPTDAAYSSVLSTLEVVTSVPNPTGSTIGPLSYTSCAGSECSGTFTPDTGYFSDLGNTSDRGTFKYKFRVTDNSLPVPVIETVERTATIDVYPLPVPTGRDFFVLEKNSGSDTVASLEVKKGATLGYTHDRGHNASGVEIIGTPTHNNGADPLVDGDFACPAGVCTGNFLLEDNWTSTDANDKARVEYKVKVAEPGGPREPTSSATEFLDVVVYPRPVPDAGVGLTNIAVWEGEPATVVLNKGASGSGAGYYHAWDDPAKGVQTSTLLRGAIDDNNWVCGVGGDCTNSFIPSIGTLPAHYGDGTSSFKYDVKTEYSSLADPNAWSNSQATVSFNVRAKAYVDANRDYNAFIEHATGDAGYAGINGATDIVIDLNDGYTYKDSTNRVTKMKLRPTSPYKNADCFGGCNASGFPCPGGVCTLPRIDSDLDKNRANIGTASLEYAVMVTDNAFTSPDDEKWSDWGQLDFDLLPRGRGEEVTASPDGVYSTDYVMTIAKGNGSPVTGYTHIENLEATHIKILGGTDSPMNLSAPLADEEFTCNRDSK